jgi:SAM-dependent methyltransferase
VRWLASRGWKAHGLDISLTAIDRARDAAASDGLEAATFAVADLSTWVPDDRYDLVTASFLHSPVDLPRSTILRVAASAVAPGGRLLVVTHAAPPPWASPAHTAHHTFQGASAELASLDLPEDEWEVELAEDMHRDASHPEHGSATLLDGVVMVKRR